MKYWEISKFQIAWNPFKNYGSLTLFFDGNNKPLQIKVNSANEYLVLQNILKFEPIYYIESGVISTAPELPKDEV